MHRKSVGFYYLEIIIFLFKILFLNIFTYTMITGTYSLKIEIKRNKLTSYTLLLFLIPFNILKNNLECKQQSK